MKYATLAIVAALAFAPVAHADDNAAETRYQTLLAQAKSDGPVDWQALRFAYADRPDFVPDGDDPDRQAMIKAMGKRDWQAVLDNAEKVFEHNYVDGIAHRVAGIADRHLDRNDEAAKEMEKADGIFASIAAGQDGKSFEHAFVVIAVSEEYDMMLDMNVQPGKQALSHQGDHTYDVIDVTDETGKTSTLYFQIDRVWAAETRMLSPK